MRKCLLIALPMGDYAHQQLVHGQTLLLTTLLLAEGPQQHRAMDLQYLEETAPRAEIILQRWDITLMQVEYILQLWGINQQQVGTILKRLDMNQQPVELVHLLGDYRLLLVVVVLLLFIAEQLQVGLTLLHSEE